MWPLRVKRSSSEQGASGCRGDRQSTLLGSGLKPQFESKAPNLSSIESLFILYDQRPGSLWALPFKGGKTRGADFVIRLLNIICAPAFTVMEDHWGDPHARGRLNGDNEIANIGVLNIYRDPERFQQLGIRNRQCEL
jgi:hypothetical protein